MSRRKALAQGGAGLAAGALAAAGLSAASAQDSTPEAAAPSTDQEHVESAMLFVQSFQGGAIAPMDGEADTYTVTLEHGLGQTIYFSDRPNRIVGSMPTPQFLDTLGFTPDNPPNAALVIEVPSGETDIAVVELFNPVFDEAGPSVSYDVQDLELWGRTVDMEFRELPTDLGQLQSEFGTAHLFIDGILDCPDFDMLCVTDYGNPRNSVVGTIPNSEHDGYCYDWGRTMCVACDPWGSHRADWADQCNQRFPACNGNCSVTNFCSSNFHAECDSFPDFTG